MEYSKPPLWCTCMHIGHQSQSSDPLKAYGEYTSPRNEFESFCKRYTCFFSHQNIHWPSAFLFTFRWNCRSFRRTQLNAPFVFISLLGHFIYDLSWPRLMRLVYIVKSARQIGFHSVRSIFFPRRVLVTGAVLVFYRVRTYDVFATTFGRRTLSIFDTIYCVARRQRRV